VPNRQTEIPKDFRTFKNHEYFRRSASLSLQGNPIEPFIQGRFAAIKSRYSTRIPGVEEGITADTGGTMGGSNFRRGGISNKGVILMLSHV